MGPSSADQVVPLSRKERRKQERMARKQKRAPKAAAAAAAAQASSSSSSTATTPSQLAAQWKNKDNIKAQSTLPNNDSDQSKKRISKDVISSENAIKRRKTTNQSSSDNNNNNKKKKTKNGDPYAGMDPALAAAMRRDDEEIAALEAKLGLGSSKAKARLNREYANLEGYGDDFGDFLEDLDNMVRRVARDGGPDNDDIDEAGMGLGHVSDDDDDQSSVEGPYHSSEDDEEDDAHHVDEKDEEHSADEEIVPMKDPAYSDDSYLEEQDNENVDANDDKASSENDSDDSEDSDTGEKEVLANPKEKITNEGNDNEDAEEASSADEEDEEEPDHDIGDTYRPSKGEDIYGKSREDTPKASAGKYVPPHLRKKQESELQDRQESLRIIERLLNNSLNRLSEDTLLPVAQAIAKLYEDHPKTDLNDSIWKIAFNTCVERPFLMTGLTPVYVAALVGVHYLRASAQLVEHLAEHTATTLCQDLEKQQNAEARGDDQDPEMISKKACNLALVLSYLYNYSVIHCNLLYDLIRKLISSFHEVDVEVLLIFLSHCGRSLRSDDPLALKEIVLAVQKRAAKSSTASSSRVEYMLAAMMDLKNNKRRPQDTAFAEKTTKLRKAIGTIKSKVATTNGKANDNSLRITLKDILEADVKGRWWRVGASWAGNQFQYQGDENGSPESDEENPKQDATYSQESDERLLKLASKYRMNSDIRRSIFCIVMAAADCDDAFEKIVRAGVLKNRNERDTVRVLMECCGNEKTYNKFYEHLANRICEYQSRCRFTFQLAFWDIFRQFDEMKLRKAANLAKLLFALVAKHHVLKLNVLKAIDMATPEDLSETGTVFLTIFFSHIMEYFEDDSSVSAFFASAIHQGKQREGAGQDNEDELGHADEADALRASLTLFFVQVLKSSPKYKKGSQFRLNLKAAIKACDTENFF